MDRMICIVGPTASGKTGLSVALAKHLGAEIVSCDSMQIYRGMDIGTAKVTPEETQGVRHHMIDVASPEEDFSVSRFVEQADAAVQDILARNKPVVLVGGTGLYVDSLIAGRSFAPFPTSGKRQELEQLAETEGIEAVMVLLQRYDPASAQRLHLSDQKRIIRAVEVYLETGTTITEHNERSKAVPPKYRPVWIGLDFENRQDLYDRINRRVDQMVRDGLFDEVRRLLDRGISPRATALQAIGYRQAACALRGEISFAQAADQIRQASRNYAKRQLTWFRRNQSISWILQPAQPDFDEIFSRALQIVPDFDRQ